MSDKDNEELFIPKKKYIVLKLFCVILIIGLIIFLGYYYYKNYYNNPNKVIEKIITSFEERMDNYKIDSKPLKINGLLNINMEMKDASYKYNDLLDVINETTIQFNGEFDENEKKSNINLSAKYKDDSLTDIDLYIDNNDIYLYMKDLYDKYLKLDNQEENNINKALFDKSLSEEDIKIITSSLFKAYSNALLKRELTRKEEKIIINSKEITANNNYLNLKNKELNDFIIDILKYLYDNNNFINTLEKNDNANIKSSIKELIDNLMENEVKATYTISFYTKKGLKQELLSIRQDITNNDEKLYFDIDIIDKNNLLISFNDTSSTIQFKINYAENILNLDITFKNDDNKFEIILQLNYEGIKEVIKENIANSINISDLEEKDLQKIDNNLRKNEKLYGFLEKIFNAFDKVNGKNIETNVT